MRDMQENLTVLDAIRAQLSGAAAELNARVNGASAVAAEIDLADYNYPRKILICVSVGIVAAGGTLDIDVESGDATATLINTDYSFAQITAVGDYIYEYTPTRRYINVEGIVGVNDVTYSVTLVMDHSRYGSQAGLVT